MNTLKYNVCCRKPIKISRYKKYVITTETN